MGYLMYCNKMIGSITNSVNEKADLMGEIETSFVIQLEDIDTKIRGKTGGYLSTTVGCTYMR